LGRSGDWQAMLRDPRFVDGVAGLLADAALRREALTAIEQLHLGKLGGQVLALGQDMAVDTEQRRAALATAARLRPAGIQNALRGLLHDADTGVASAALDGLVELQDTPALREVFGSDAFSAEVRRRVIDRLMGSTTGAIVLLRLIDTDQLPAEL